MRSAQLGPSSRRLITAFPIVVIAFCAAVLNVTGAFAQPQPPQSVADAARRAREQKKPEPSSGKVWTNDNVPTSGTGISVVGEAPTPAAADSGEKAAEKPAGAPAKSMTPEEVAKKRADLQAQLEDARKDQDRLEKELDLAKRDLDLQTQQAYSNPMALSNNSAEGQLQPYRDAMNSKVDQLEKTKAKIADLQKQLDELQQQGSGSTPQQ